MKKLTAFILSALMAVTALTGCGGQSSSSEASKDNSSSQGSTGDWSYIADKGDLVIGITYFEPMNYKDENGKTLMYAAPSNFSPASEEYEALVKERVEKLREANPDMDETAIPVDLVTCSGSGLDPHISPAAAEYQVARISKANDMTEDEVRQIIKKCTDGKFLGLFGEETVNVLKVNLMLDGIL